MAARKKNPEKLINMNMNSTEKSSNTDQNIQGNIIPFKKLPSNTVPVVPEFVITLKEAKKRIDKLKRFVDEMMTPGVDYGIVSEVNKPTLLKPGAEKLCDAFGFSKRVEVINRYEDWHHGLFHYEVKVTLICKRSGLIESEGIGCCNSKESTYKDQNGNDIVNTIIKMAKKRALIDAVLSATRSSDIFTQDVEEMEWLWNKGSKGSISQSIPVTRKQLSFIFTIVKQKKLPIEEVKSVMTNRYNITESKQLTLQQASDFIDFLKAYQHQDIVQNKELPTDL